MASGYLQQYWSQLEKERGLPSGYLATIRQIESGGNPNAVSSTGATGPFQFTKGTARQFNLPLAARTDEIASARAAADLAASNGSFLTKGLGRAPTPHDLYLAHQQGAGGAVSLLRAPTRAAGAATDPRNISVNAGDPNAPAQAFIDKFRQRYDQVSARLGGNQGQGPTVANAAAQPQTPPAVAPPAGLLNQEKAGGLLGFALGNTTGTDQAMGAGKGLVGMAMQDNPVTAKQVGAFMGGPAVSGALAGVGMLAQGMAGTKGPTMELAPIQTEENRPDMSLLELLKRKKGFA